MTEEQPRQPEHERRLRFKQALERAQSRSRERPAGLVEQEQEQEQEPLVPASPRPLDAARLLGLKAEPGPEVRRPPLALAPLAGLAWSGAVLLLLFGNLGPEAGLSQRLLYSLLLLCAGLLTFVPLQWALRLPTLSWRGTVGWGLLFYALAFVPAPSSGSWLLTLPELPVYLILILSVFLAVNAAATPVIYVLGLHIFRRRTQRFDLGRVGRQAVEAGLFAAGLAALAFAKMLTLISLVLLAAILALGEIFILGGQVRER